MNPLKTVKDVGLATAVDPVLRRVASLRAWSLLLGFLVMVVASNWGVRREVADQCRRVGRQARGAGGQALADAHDRARHVDVDALEARTNASPEDWVLSLEHAAHTVEALRRPKPHEAQALWPKAAGTATPRSATSGGGASNTATPRSIAAWRPSSPRAVERSKAARPAACVGESSPTRAREARRARRGRRRRADECSRASCIGGEAASRRALGRPCRSRRAARPC